MLSPSNFSEIPTAAGFAQLERITASVNSSASPVVQVFSCVCIKPYADRPQALLSPWDMTAMELVYFLRYLSFSFGNTEVPEFYKN